MDLKLLLRFMPDLYLVLDTQFNIIEFSDAYAKATMIKRENILGQHIFDVFPDNPADPTITGMRTVNALLEHVLKNKVPEAITDLKYDIAKPTSQDAVFEERYWSLITVPVLSDMGEVLYLLMRVQDVTDSVKLKKSQELTEKKHMQESAQFTADRKNAKNELQQTLEQLKASNVELEQFAYIASHDLQEPLRMVASFTQLLEHRYADSLNEEAREFIHFAVDGAQRMQLLLNDLLLYSRITREKRPFEMECMETILQQVLANLSFTIKEHEAIITHDPLPLIYVNKIQFAQLIKNLITNGIKFHPKNQIPHIHISAILHKDEWLFSIRDDGIGISTEYLNQVFVIFKRLHARTAYEGTGIGLAICKKIVEGHGGRIWAESVPGKETTFYFTLPKREN